MKVQRHLCCAVFAPSRLLSVHSLKKSNSPGGNAELSEVAIFTLLRDVSPATRTVPNRQTVFKEYF